MMRRHNNHAPHRRRQLRLAQPRRRQPHPGVRRALVLGWVLGGVLPGPETAVLEPLSVLRANAKLPIFLREGGPEGSKLLRDVVEWNTKTFI